MKKDVSLYISIIAIAINVYVLIGYCTNPRIKAMEQLYDQMSKQSLHPDDTMKHVSWVGNIAFLSPDSEAFDGTSRRRWHDGRLFATKPNDTWPWLIFDSATYKASKWFGKMDTPHAAQWIQRGELIPDGVTVHENKSK